MVSSRRLAREWALKILYQIDVGKFAPHEAQDSALERLRKEFVQRGSRSASGSHAEELSLEMVTAQLRDTLPTLRLPMERALETVIGRLFEEAPYWLELRIERAFRTYLRGVVISPPRLLTPLSDSRLMPTPGESTDGHSLHLEQLTPDERSRFLDFVVQARADLPRLHDAEFRKTAREFVKRLAAERPLIGLGEWLYNERVAFNNLQTERWRKVGAMVQKQTGDWLRTAAFTHKLAVGAHDRSAEIDSTIAALSSGWRLERQVAVDRNILRLAGFEMLYLPSIPTAATINEAVELAKKYSTTESGRFVNGVLGALAPKVGDKLSPQTHAEDSIESDTRDDIVDLPETDLDDSTSE